MFLQKFVGSGKIAAAYRQERVSNKQADQSASVTVAF
jgi:hypothetical protein